VGDIGSNIDVDNTFGYGPEVYSVNVAEGDTLPPGDYVVRAHYFRNAYDPEPAPIDWTVDVVKFAGTPNEVRQTFTGTIVEANSGTAGPGGTGPAWADVGVVTIP
jgi:uncharacterized protein YfaP (DUF2135 family)